MATIKEVAEAAQVSAATVSRVLNKDDSISVRSKSLTNEYLTVSTSAASTIRVVTIGVIPAAYLCIGIGVVIRRKRR